MSFVLLIAGWFFVVSAGLFALLGTTARTEFEFQILRGDESSAQANEAGEGQNANERSSDEAPSGTLRLRSGASNWFSAHLGIVFGACAIVFAGLGWQCLDRASAAALLATAATKAIGAASRSRMAGIENADLLAYLMCIEAKSNWLEGRLNHDRIDWIASTLFGDRFRGKPPVDGSHEESE